MNNNISNSVYFSVSSSILESNFLSYIQQYVATYTWRSTKNRIWDSVYLFVGDYVRTSVRKSIVQSMRNCFL